MKTTFVIASSHPSLHGHFPENPIVPGVVILEEVLTQVKQPLEESLVLATIPVVKFLSPLRPNEIVHLLANYLPDHLVTFTCQVGSRLIASGEFIFETQSPDSLPL